MSGSASDAVGTVSIRAVAHSVENRLSELHFTWRINSWTETLLAKSKPNGKHGSTESDLVDTKDMGVDRGEWWFELSWNKLASPHLSGTLRYQDLSDDHRDKIWAAIQLRVFSDDPQYSTDPHRTSEEWPYFNSVDFAQDVVADEEFWSAKCVTFEAVLLFYDCDYSRSFKRIPGSLAEQRRMYEAGALTDFVLISSDKKELKTHRIVLAANCNVFEAMLTHDTQEKRTGICEIKDMDYETLKVVVDSFYRGDVSEKLAEIPVKVFVAADKYGLKDLERVCHEPLKDSVDLENVVKLYILACRHDGLDDLKSEVVEYVRSNFDEFIDGGGMERIMKEAPDLYRGFFKLCGRQKSAKKRSAAEAGIEED